MEHDWKDGARQQFDSWAEGYEGSLLQQVLFKPAHDALLVEVQRRDARRVLDIGCGTGVFGRRAVQLCPRCEVNGLDISEEMIRIAREKSAEFKRVSFLLGDSERLPFESGTFDCVTCSHSFHHYPHPLKVLQEMRRVLAPGGVALIVDGNPTDLLGFFIFEIIVRLYEGWRVHHLSQGDFVALLRAAGFQSPKFRRLHGPAPLVLPLVLVIGQVAP
ncbi:MAG: methyltransferase domain-containing protein [Planctomycetota bacterium]